MNLTVLDIVLMSVIFLLAVFIIVRPFLPFGKKEKDSCTSCRFCTMDECPIRKSPFSGKNKHC